MSQYKHTMHKFLKNKLKYGVAVCSVFGLFLITYMLLYSSPSKAKTADITRSNKPHIIFVMADDYGFHDIGYHGSEILTPNLDRLAFQGVRLENYYVQPICTPTRANFMTGRYQTHLGMQHHILSACTPSGLPANFPTIADKMRDSGYSTHIVGKWHLGYSKKDFLPTNRGFDTFFGYLGGSEDYYRHVHTFRNMSGIDLRNNLQPVRNETNHYSTHLFTEKAIDLVRRYRHGDKPLFLYLSYQAVHAPLQVPDTYLHRHPHIQDENRKVYAGMTLAMDEGIGNLTAELRKNSMFDNTVIVFSTDNGASYKFGGSNWPLKGSKGTLWEGGVRGVGFVSSPLLHNGAKGTVSRQLMHVTDWYPTFLHLANGDLAGTRSLDGYNQWNTLQNLAENQRDEILHSIDPIQVASIKQPPTNKGTFDTRIRAALRVGDWKIVTGSSGMELWLPPMVGNYSIVEQKTTKNKTVWLFNITEDPSENNDLSESRPDKVREMLHRLSEHQKTLIPDKFGKCDKRADPKLLNGFWGPWL